MTSAASIPYSAQLHLQNLLRVKKHAMIQESAIKEPCANIRTAPCQSCPRALRSLEWDFFQHLQMQTCGCEICVRTVQRQWGLATAVPPQRKRPLRRSATFTSCEAPRAPQFFCQTGYACSYDSCKFYVFVRTLTLNGYKSIVYYVVMTS